MNNAELRGMLNELARLIVLSRAIPAQLLSKAQRLYHVLEMEATELPQKKYARCAQEKMRSLKVTNIFSEAEIQARQNFLKLTKQLLHVDEDIERTCREITVLQFEQRRLSRNRDAIIRELETTLVEIGTGKKISRRN